MRIFLSQNPIIHHGIIHLDLIGNIPEFFRPERNIVFIISGVIRYLFWLGKPATIRESEINLMKQYLDGIYGAASLSSLTKGQLYKISEGPLAGKTGKVIEAQKSKIKLELESLGMLVTLKRVEA